MGRRRKQWRKKQWRRNRVCGVEMKGRRRRRRRSVEDGATGCRGRTS